MAYNRLPEFIDESVADEVMQRLDAIERPAKKPRERWLAELKPKVLSLHNDGVSVKEIYSTINVRKRLVSEKEIVTMVGKGKKTARRGKVSAGASPSATDETAAEVPNVAKVPASLQPNGAGDMGSAVRF